MIITRLRVHPFGFFSDKEIRFEPGLNVVLGPNEAGKSTLFSAIRSSLLRARLKKTEFDRLMARFLPAEGGDVARLEMEFVTPSGPWVLKRQWGADAQIRASSARRRDCRRRRGNQGKTPGSASCPAGHVLESAHDRAG